MVTAVFTDSVYSSVTGLWQWDYGQTLRIQGLLLPSAVEIHFSLQEAGGEAMIRIGVTKDGVTDVPIPDTMLGQEVSRDYYIYAFIYLEDETSGKTTHRIRMKVRSRPRPEASGGDGETPYECLIDHDSTANPDWDISVRTLWKPYHSRDPKWALPWIQPTGAHDMYKAGEYMVWTDGTIWHCLEGTNFNPEEYPQAWEQEG